MKDLLALALRSLWNRRTSASLIVLSVAISVALLLVVRDASVQARNAFQATVSGTDLIVGARSGQLNLLLYSVFRLGDATNDISWETFQRISGHRDVAWTIPLSLGDSHRGFRVLGTTDQYFEHFRFGQERRLELATGSTLLGPQNAVIGAEVARTLGYRVGAPIVIAHGLGETSFVQHEDAPFRVSGVLRPTGTPVDRTVHISLEAIEAIHGAAPAAAPLTITGMLVGLKSKLATFRMQRAINQYRAEPLLAILPGVALQQLWSIVGVIESMMVVVGAVVVFAALLSLLTSILTGLNERRREMAILRSVGARPLHVFLLFMSEGAMLATLGVVAGAVLSQLVMLLARPILGQQFGLLLEPAPPSPADVGILFTIIGAALLVGAIPAWRAYRRTLADGLAIRV